MATLMLREDGASGSIQRMQPHKLPREAGHAVGWVKSPENTVGTKIRGEWGFGYGESEYEVSFGLPPRNGDL